MIGIFLIAIGEIFAEIGTSIGKYEVSHKKESLYAMGFLNAFWALVFLSLITLLWGEFIFSFESLPTFIVKIVLEMILVFITLNAVLKADRSTFAFLRTLTIPFLLITDLFLGYMISILSLVGICIVVFTLLFLLLNHGLGYKGKFISLVSSLLAVGTIALYKYNITHYNSVEAEQILTFAVILITLAIAARIHAKENVFKYLRHRIFMTQSLASGIASVFISFAYLFAPASIITTAKRSFEIIASMISGRVYFHEKHLIVKIIAFLLIVIGIGLMAF